MAAQLAPRTWLNHASTNTQAVEKPVPWGFLEFFVISQTALPALLFVPGAQAVRLPLRVGAYAISLGALFLWGRQMRKVAPHPAQIPLVLAIGWLVLMIFHPHTNTMLAGAAQTMLYLAVLAPVLWAPALVENPAQLRRLLVLLLLCNGFNALVGVLQVYDPATWMPAEFSVVQRAMKAGLQPFYYKNDSGQMVLRPPGLFDTPGAVCMPGMMTVVLGLAFFLNTEKLWQRYGSLFLAAIGLMAVYVSHVRVALVLCGGVTLSYLALLYFVQKDHQRASKLLGLAVLMAVLITPVAVRFGGQSIGSRFTTLVAKDPLTVYYEAQRGRMVEEAVTTLLPLYPFGAGLGRWGMMRTYFGDEFNADSPMIWSEVQLPSWILDGGIILTLLYIAALFIATRYEWRITAATQDKELRAWAPIIMAANCGTIALCMSFPPFTAPHGMQYWFLAGILHGAVQAHQRTKAA